MGTKPVCRQRQAQSELSLDYQALTFKLITIFQTTSMKKMYSLDDILHLDKRFRTQLINSLSGFKSANLIGTAAENGRTNLAIFSSVVHVGANPPLVGMISRPHSVPRHTLENILETGYYTINQVHQSIVEKAHQTSARYDGSEFEAVQLTPEYIDDFSAPYVKESIIKMGLQLEEVVDIKLNGTKFIIGKIIQLIVPDSFINEDGKINIEQAKTVAVSGLDTYHTTQELVRLPYAKPDKII